VHPDLAPLTEAIAFDGLARVVLFDPGRNKLDIEGDDLAQAGDFGL
jgi:hypothetical protein